MKKLFSLLLMIALIVGSCTTVYAFDEPARSAVGADGDTPAYVGDAGLAAAGDAPLSVPRIDITTENGSGTTLQKADGYVNASISITDTHGSVLSGDILFKVRGNSTALTSIQKKSFTFKFGKKTEVLGMGRGKKWALLANCFDPTLLRNYIAFELAQELGLPYTSQQRVAELWLDGSYRGCYTVYEPVQEGKDRVDIDVESNDGKRDFLIEYEATRVEDDVAYITVSGQRFALKEPEEPDEAQTEYVTDVLTDIIDTLKSGSEAEVRQRIDVDSFAALYLLNEYAKTADFGFSSVFFFYKDGMLYAGPPWDYDLALGNLNGELNSSSAKAASRSDGIMQDKQNLYRWLCDKEWFRSEIKRVYALHYDFFENISSDGGLSDTLRERYADVIGRNFGTWSVSRWWLNYQKIPYATYEENYAFFKNWCADRNDWLSDYFGLYRAWILSGDTDCDGCVSIVDATLIQRTLANISINDTFDSFSADSDRDGSLSVTDATFIQRFLAGLSAPDNINKQISIMKY